ncbi:hypothetical protein LX32DRAFT_192644 [Colletotrichum zoysiae]|uniref:Uncharacterized protein n=1 Tax=Colletotrichum zoysiae TaxID=1216348 RepID=A0AAD9H5G0_9PEZI|nr:hypothetical protein LX32DRAFT_192644 [Colletotrichum zoysiae]
MAPPLLGVIMPSSMVSPLAPVLFPSCCPYGDGQLITMASNQACISLSSHYEVPLQLHGSQIPCVSGLIPDVKKEKREKRFGLRWWLGILRTSISGTPATDMQLGGCRGPSMETSHFSVDQAKVPCTRMFYGYRAIYYQSIGRNPLGPCGRSAPSPPSRSLPPSSSRSLGFQ